MNYQILTVSALFWVLLSCSLVEAAIPPSSRRAQLTDTLRQAQIDAERLVKDDDSLGKALTKELLENLDAPIDILSVCRLESRIDHDASDSSTPASDLQGQCTVEMFDLTQQAKIAPPNVTLAFGNDRYAKNRDFVEWCHRLLTSSYFDDDETLERFRQDMVLANPYWKAAVKATYLTALQGSDPSEFDIVVQDPKQWADAVRSLPKPFHY